MSELTHHWAKDCPCAFNDVGMTENMNKKKHSEKTIHDFNDRS